MNCERAKRLVHELLWQDFSPTGRGEGNAEAAALEQHLGACARCRAELHQLRLLRSRLHALGGKQAPAGLASRIMSAVRLEQHRARRRRAARRLTQIRPGRALAALAAAAAIAAVGLYAAARWPQKAAVHPPLQAEVTPLAAERTGLPLARSLAPAQVPGTDSPLAASSGRESPRAADK